MNKQIEALKMAIEALDTLMMEKGSIYQQALKACKEALAEAEKQEIGEAEIRQMLKDIEYYQKRVEELEQPAPMQMNQTLECPSYLHGMKSYHPAPSWQGLDAVEVSNIFISKEVNGDATKFARAIEQALKEKNHG